jgi:hypothetical protein
MLSYKIIQTRYIDADSIDGSAGKNKWEMEGDNSKGERREYISRNTQVIVNSSKHSFNRRRFTPDCAASKPVAVVAKHKSLRPSEFLPVD